MFILRGVSLVLSILGYLLAGTLVYFGFIPLEYPTQPDLNLKALINCNSTSINYNLKDLDSKKISELKTKIGNNAPIDLIRDFMSSIDSVSQNIGSSPELNLQYCDVQQTTKEVLEQVNSELLKQEKYYEFGLFNDFVKSVNELPFAKINNIQLNIESTFARTNVCNSAITKTKMYLFTVVDSGVQNIKKAIMFKISLQLAETANEWQKFTRNLVTTGQYFKAQYQCNG